MWDVAALEDERIEFGDGDGRVLQELLARRVDFVKLLHGEAVVVVLVVTVELLNVGDAVQLLDGHVFEAEFHLAQLVRVLSFEDKVVVKVEEVYVVVEKHDAVRVVLLPDLVRGGRGREVRGCQLVDRFELVVFGRLDVVLAEQSVVLGGHRRRRRRRRRCWLSLLGVEFLKQVLCELDEVVRRVADFG